MTWRDRTWNSRAAAFNNVKGGLTSVFKLLPKIHGRLGQDRRGRHGQQEKAHGCHGDAGCGELRETTQRRWPRCDFVAAVCRDWRPRVLPSAPRCSEVTVDKRRNAAAVVLLSARNRCLNLIGSQRCHSAGTAWPLWPIRVQETL